MLKYKIDVLEELKGKGYTSYKLRKDKIMGEAQIQKIRQGEIASKETHNVPAAIINPPYFKHFPNIFFNFSFSEFISLSFSFIMFCKSIKYISFHFISIF